MPDIPTDHAPTDHALTEDPLAIDVAPAEPAIAPADHPDPSYRALLEVPTLGRILLATGIARIAQSMVGVALVLFTLQEYGSPELAGIVTFAALFPGLVVSPIAGALLDRHGRTRLILLDYAVETVAMVLIGLLALADALPPALLVLIAVASSFTAILSVTGLRSLFPLLVPRYLWERVNAVDSNGYVVATIIGPPVAAALVAVAGGAVAMVVIGLAFALAALPMIGVPDPPAETDTSGRLLVDAWRGLLYFLHHPTLRGLAASITVLNLAYGMSTIFIPLTVLKVLGASELAVGVVFALSGLSGMASAFFFGRFDSRGREWWMLIVPMILMAPAYAIVAPVAAGLFGITAGLALMGLSSLILGFLNGPMDIALFTVRQRRTDPLWLGRGFAVSMAANFMGYPIGAAIGGTLAAISLPGSVALGVGFILLGTLLGAVLLPRRDPNELRAPSSG